MELADCIDLIDTIDGFYKWAVSQLSLDRKCSNKENSSYLKKCTPSLSNNKECCSICYLKENSITYLPRKQPA